MRVADIRKRSTRLRTLLTILCVSLLVLVMLERFSVPLIALWRHGSDDETLRGLGLASAAIVPDIFYLAALWGIRTALADFAKGEFFAPAITAMLERVGRWLAIGAVVSVFIVPLTDTLLKHGPGYWIALDISGLVLGAVGLSLTIVGGVLARGAEIQTELDEMF